MLFAVRNSLVSSSSKARSSALISRTFPASLAVWRARIGSRRVAMTMSRVVGQMKRILQQAGAAVALQEMHVVDDQRDGLQTQGIRDPTPQLPDLSVLLGPAGQPGHQCLEPIAATAWSCHSPLGPRQA